MSKIDELTEILVSTLGDISDSFSKLIKKLKELENE